MQAAGESLAAEAVGALPRAAGQVSCADDATRITLVVLSQLIDWRVVLTIVKPDTLIRWHRRGFRLFWRWKSRAPGRPPLPADLQQLIVAMARANVTWGQERIAAELHRRNPPGYRYATMNPGNPSVEQAMK